MMQERSSTAEQHSGVIVLANILNVAGDCVVVTENLSGPRRGFCFPCDGGVKWTHCSFKRLFLVPTYSVVSGGLSAVI